MYVGFQFCFILFHLEVFLLIPSRFSIGGDILAAPVECSTLQVIHPFYSFVLNFNDTNRLFLNVIAQRKVI